MNCFIRFFALVGLSFCMASPVYTQMFNEQTFKFGKVLEWIDKYYVDSVNQDLLVEHAITELLKELDPHSSYLNRKEVEQLNEPLQGNFEGIGISFNMLTDTILVISTIPGGPSEKMGLLPGDKILYVKFRPHNLRQ